jgi:SAM-dependent methyltransferase
MQIAPMQAAANPLFELQQTLYASSNYTRRRLHGDRLRWVSAAIAQYGPQAPLSRAIEYGPGSGIYLPILARHCAHVIGADIEQAYLDGMAPQVAALSNLELTVDDIEDSSFGDDSFGLVLCSEVLEHVRRPERALKTLYRILCPGGIAVVTTPQRYSVMELCCKLALLPGIIGLVRLIYREPVLPTGHISLRSQRALGRAIADAGFRVGHHVRFGLYLPLLAEFGGDRGGRAIEALEHRLAGTAAEHAFWTQAYVLQKPAGA